MPTSLAGRIVAALAAAVVLILILTQIFLPGIGEGAIEDRLTENGGVANVSLSAKPAARLLWGDGDRVGVEATGVELDLQTSDDPVVFENLDRFGEVEVILNDSLAGPVELDSLILTRDGSDPYRLEARGQTSLADISEFLATSSDIPGSDFLGGVLDVIGVGDDLDIDLDMELDSDGGRIDVVSGDGEVAGIPVTPIAELIITAIDVGL